MDIRSFLVANAQAAKLVQPGEGPLHDPAPPPKSAAVVCVALCEQRLDATLAQAFADRLRIITTVAYNAVRPMAWPSPKSLQWRDGINECKCLL